VEEVGFDELFYEFRKCHHKAVELNEVQEAIMARHLLENCIVYRKPAKNTEQQVQADSSTNSLT
jgi:hypothetical protein